MKNEILSFKFAAINYPLNERCFKELRHPSIKLFTKPWYFYVNAKENQIQDSSEYIYGWLGDIHLKLATEGFVELSQKYKNIDLDNIKEFPISHENRIKLL